MKKIKIFLLGVLTFFLFTSIFSINFLLDVSKKETFKNLENTLNAKDMCWERFSEEFIVGTWSSIGDSIVAAKITLSPDEVQVKYDYEDFKPVLGKWQYGKDDQVLKGRIMTG
ncbi:MAG: hypothetical protein KatS3mg085_040 [Candidatus Dojkabacteria bacterium]|nr:MAG: hypothetical protein KatS3mg085_040 [Candidatus Dojkabacteria bacterium]